MVWVEYQFVDALKKSMSESEAAKQDIFSLVLLMSSCQKGIDSFLAIPGNQSVLLVTLGVRIYTLSALMNVVPGIDNISRNWRDSYQANIASVINKGMIGMNESLLEVPEVKQITFNSIMQDLQGYFESWKEFEEKEFIQKIREYAFFMKSSDETLELKKAFSLFQWEILKPFYEYIFSKAVRQYGRSTWESIVGQPIQITHFDIKDPFFIFVKSMVLDAANLAK